MKLCKSVLAVALALILALTPVISPLHIHAAESLTITAVSGDASTIKLTTNLPYDVLVANLTSVSLDLKQSRVANVDVSNIAQDSNGCVILPITFEASVPTGQTYCLFGTSTVSLGDTTYSLGQDYIFQYSGSA